MLTANYHIHSHYSPCAGNEMTLPAILDAAEEAGYDTIGITDHCYSLDLNSGRVAELRSELEEACKGRSLSVRLGLEAYVLRNGVASIMSQVAGLFDFVVVAPNHYHVRGVAQPARLSPRVLAEHELYMFEAAVNSPITDVIAHPFVLSPLYFRIEPDRLAQLSRAMMGALDEKRLVQALDRAHHRRLAVEVNVKVVKYEQTHLESLFRLCLERGVKLCMGTDAHELAEIASTRESIRFVESFGASAEDLWRPLTYD